MILIQDKKYFKETTKSANVRSFYTQTTLYINNFPASTISYLWYKKKYFAWATNMEVHQYSIKENPNLSTKIKQTPSFDWRLQILTINKNEFHKKCYVTLTSSTICAHHSPADLTAPHFHSALWFLSPAQSGASGCPGLSTLTYRWDEHIFRLICKGFCEGSCWEILICVCVWLTEPEVPGVPEAEQQNC